MLSEQSGAANFERVQQYAKMRKRALGQPEGPLGMELGEGTLEFHLDACILQRFPKGKGTLFTVLKEASRKMRMMRSMMFHAGNISR